MKRNPADKSDSPGPTAVNKTSEGAATGQPVPRPKRVRKRDVGARWQEAPWEEYRAVVTKAARLDDADGRAARRRRGGATGDAREGGGREGVT